MNILRLSTLSLILAIAVMTLGYANPSFAAPKKCGGNPDTVLPGCGGTADVAAEFKVALLQGGLPDEANGMVISKDEDACGTTEGENRGATFPEGCVTVFDVDFDPAEGAELDLRAFSLEVRLNKSDMMIFFTDMEIPDSGPVSNDTVYVSDRLPVTISRDGDSFTVEVNMENLALIKAHHERKGDLVGPIAIGKIVFTPDPP